MFKKDIQKNLPVIFLLVLALSFYFSFVFENPLEALHNFFVVKHYILSAFFYILFIFLSVVFYPITILPAIPFISKIFGASDTFVFTLTGMILGSLLSFFVARYQSDSFFHKFFPKERLDNMTKRFSRNLNFYEVFFYKLSSPPKGFSYFVGKYTKIKAWKYFIASFLGMLPITFIMAFSADAIVHKREDIILFFLLLFSAFLVLISHLFSNIFFKKNKAKIISKSDSFSIANIFSIATIELFLEKRGLPFELILTTDDDKIKEYKEEKKLGKEIFLINTGWELDSSNDFFDKEKVDLQEDLKKGHTIFNDVWDKYGEKLTGSKFLSIKLKETLIENVSYFEKDNYVSLNKYDNPRMDLEYVINTFNTDSKNKELRRENFFKAVSWAKIFLKSEIEKYQK